MVESLVTASLLLPRPSGSQNRQHVSQKRSRRDAERSIFDLYSIERDEQATLQHCEPLEDHPVQLLLITRLR